jgi:hypothetical protein
MINLERRLSALESKVNNIVRCGFVTAVDGAKGHVRVRLPEKGDFVTPWLQVLQPVTNGGAGDYAMPRVDDQVAVLFIPVGLSRSVGLVLGSMYSLAQMPPVDDPEVRVIVGKEVLLGSSDADDYVALASLVKTALDQLKTAISTAVPAAGSADGGTALLASIVANLASWPPEVAAQKVKAE